MALLTRSNIMAVKEETTAGTLEDLSAGSEFVKIREGFSITNENEVVESDQLVNGIGKAAPIVVGENPSASCPLYTKGSGVEGTEPEYGIMIKSAMGDVTVNAVEYDVVSANTTSITLDTGEGILVEEGQAFLIKDGTNGYSIRNIDSVSSETATLNFQLASAPAAAVNLGKAITYKPASSGHPTYSLYRWQSDSSAGFRDAVSGVRTTAMTFDFPARTLAEANFSMEGLNYYYDYLKVAATNEDIDFVSGVVTHAVSLTNKVYKTPIDVAAEMATQMTASSVDTITAAYNSSTGITTLTSDGTHFELLTNTGTNVATSVWADMGFSVAADNTGALTYDSGAISFDPSLTPSYDDSDPIPVVSNELFIGDADDSTCRKAVSASFSIDTPKTQVTCICATNGVDETLTLERNATLTATLILQKYEAELFQKSFKNTTTAVCFNSGIKDASSNWTPGKCMNIYFQNAKINTVPIEDNDGYMVISMTATGFVGTGTQDVFINYL